jgi:hypothetical protein
MASGRTHFVEAAVEWAAMGLQGSQQRAGRQARQLIRGAEQGALHFPQVVLGLLDLRCVPIRLCFA